ncbi:uncharacterized protein EDB91DRAFT_1242530 [Suillus paluster]|uniref:uncharacterized protein n=1 Tax=Suillus paluster TaxID=48578 RepID=UPI001B86CC16|nr:uncharacterized protein EDB91DRAFT_1242530 [Suillus paluster]KAG1753547.1 hypothetical protein EDB91DRAFT_1242530 [Suillus paluster]
MSAALLSAITDDPDIKQGLFPSPGTNPRAGGKTKATYHWALCVILFKEHPDYKSAFLMSKITRKYMDEMGETGAGITREDKINMDVKNSFTTKWAIIKEACPWFFEMYELIAECPNQVPVGLGHSQIDFDMSVMIADASEPTSGFTSDNIAQENSPEVSEGVDELENDDLLSDLGSAGLAEADDAPLKQKASTERQGKSSLPSKTGPQHTASKPVTRAPKNPAKRQKKDEFTEIAQAEAKPLHNLLPTH